MSGLETDAARLAREYIDLGGTRRAKLDDNIVDTRKWDDEPERAATYWRDKIAPLPEEKRREVETNLPTMNAE